VPTTIAAFSQPRKRSLCVLLTPDQRGQKNLNVGVSTAQD
jgi:hypothetical protein